MKNLSTEILIDATPREVWAVLTDLPAYPAWNPFLTSATSATGRLDPHGRLTVALAPPGGRRVMLRPVVTELVPCQVLEWWGHVGFRGIFDGRHRFELHPSGSGTRLVQRETFTGILVPLLARSIDRGTRAGFVAMNEALKAETERNHAPAGPPGRQPRERPC